MPIFPYANYSYNGWLAMGRGFMKNDTVIIRLTLCLAGFLFFAVAQAQERTLAIVDEKPVMLSDVSPTKAELAEAAQAMSVSKQLALSRLRHNKFMEQVLNRVLNVYSQQHDINADETLVEAFKEKFGQHYEASQDSSRSFTDIAKEQVRFWQVEKKLYEEFGGTVIFTQQNPRYPVEAYHRLLEQYQAERRLVFKDKEYENLLKRAFAPPYSMQIPSEKVDYNSPWWMHQQPGGDTPPSNAADKP
ncbi:hypothetical protein [Salinimonas chungwhensis]|uniref:hypothetical protein n=1 Tax=Salinimonas chungwhensis TaxID=265425 RepID=UPI0003611566|nr:hypothetical protein [Salinimonas chungwhensis]